MNENFERAERISHALKRPAGQEDRESSNRSNPKGRITKVEYYELLEDRPHKFTAEEVGYRKAPRGSEYRCENCVHFYTRQVDKFHTCEIFRSPEVDDKGVDAKYLCDWWTGNGDDHPLAE